jgi:hypothetical protein
MGRGVAVRGGWMEHGRYGRGRYIIACQWDHCSVLRVTFCHEGLTTEKEIVRLQRHIFLLRSSVLKRNTTDNICVDALG